MSCWILPESAEHGGDEHRQNGPQVGQYLADVVAAGAQNGEDCIACRSLEWAAREATVRFHVPGLGLDGAASSQEFRQHRRDAFSHAADQHAGVGSDCARSGR